MSRFLILSIDKAGRAHRRGSCGGRARQYPCVRRIRQVITTGCPILLLLSILWAGVKYIRIVLDADLKTQASVVFPPRATRGAPADGPRMNFVISMGLPSCCLDS